MAMRRVAKIFFIFSILILVTQCAAYFYTCAMVRKRAETVLQTAAERGWTVAFPEAFTFRPRIFGAVAIVGNIEARHLSGLRLHAERLAFKYQLGFAQTVQITNFAASKESNHLFSPHLNVSISRQNEYRFTSTVATSYLSKIMDGLSIKAAKLSGVVRVRHGLYSAKLQIGLQTWAHSIAVEPSRRFVIHGVSTRADLNFTDAQLVLAFDEPGAQPTVANPISEILIQRLSGRLGGLHVLVAGKVAYDGNGRMTAQISDIRAAARAWQDQSLIEQAHFGLDKVLQLARKLSGQLPDKIAIPVTMQNWQIAQPRFELLKSLQLTSP